MYESLHIFDMLSVEEIPASVKMCGHNIPVNYVKLETKSATLTSGGSFLRDILAQYNTTLYLLFMEGLTTAIINFSK